MALTLPPPLCCHQSRPWHHPGESHMNRHTCGRGKSAYLCVCVSSQVYVSTCISQCCDWFHRLVSSTLRGKKNNNPKKETLQCCRPLIKSLKYSSNLHKNLSSKQQWIFLSSSSSVADYIFSLWRRPCSSLQFVFQTLILHALRTAAIFPKETPMGVYLGHEYKCWEYVQQELQFIWKCLSIVYARVKTKCSHF